MSKYNLKVTRKGFKSRFCIQDWDYDDIDWDAYKNTPASERLEDFPKLSFEEAYEINYKKKGYLKDFREIYIDLDCEYEFIEGDEIKLLGEWYAILDRQFDLEEKIITYRILRYDSESHQNLETRSEDKFLKRIEKSVTNLLSSIFKNIPNGKD